MLKASIFCTEAGKSFLRKTLGDSVLIPIFPLNVVLYPRMPLPLHIFEERYKEMIQECLDLKQPFGVVLANKGHISTVGTMAKIENVLQKMEDGRMNILCLGDQRFQIKEVIEKRSFLQAEVDYYPDDEEDEQQQLQLMEKGKVLLRNFATLTGKQANPELFDSYQADSFSFLLAELSDMSLLQHQEILEMTSTIQRLNRVICQMDKLLKRFRLNKKIQNLVDSDMDFTQICN
jgi:Lon protease-like protein